MLPEITIRILAATMAVCHAGAWVLASRWVRAGKTATLRARFGTEKDRGRRVLSVAGDVALVAVLVYPVVVVAVPSISYGTAVDWSGSFARGIQAFGLAAWIVGLALALWSTRTLGRYVAVDGVAVDHELVTHGPYAWIRHPLYTAFIWIGFGAALLFVSYLILALAALIAANALQWARIEERLFSSSSGFGASYRVYMERTGRFLPRRGASR